MKLRPVGAELFHTERTERQTDMTNLIIAFRNVANSLRPQSVTLEGKMKIKADAGIKILKLKAFPMIKGSTQKAGLHFTVNQ
jgi:hypothetical protein